VKWRGLTKSNWRIENAVPAGHVNADREAIHQIFSNLIENALKYAASGKKIILGARAAANGVEFYVRDFGPGISSEHLAPSFFERFYRVDKARSRESGGTGLGLGHRKHIVLAHEERFGPRANLTTARLSVHPDRFRGRFIIVLKHAAWKLGPGTPFCSDSDSVSSDGLRLRGLPRDLHHLRDLPPTCMARATTHLFVREK